MVDPTSNDDQLSKLYQARDNVQTLIVQVTTKPKPNYEIDGQSVDWGDYLKQLSDQLKFLNNQIIDLEGPYEIETQAFL